jgi:hypothetical protein
MEQPPDAEIKRLLNSLGVENYQPAVVNQLLEFCYRTHLGTRL